MDFTLVKVILTNATLPVFAAAMIIVGGYAAVWGIKLVINTFSHDDPGHDPLAYYSTYSEDSIEYSDFDDLPIDSDFSDLAVDYNDPYEPRELGDTRTFYS